MAWSEDTSGVKPKPAPASFNTNLDYYKDAVEWIKDFIQKVHGIPVHKVIHDAYPDIWRVYDDQGSIVVNIDGQFMKRIALVLEQIDWLWAEEHDRLDEQAQMEERYREALAAQEEEDENE